MRELDITSFSISAGAFELSNSYECRGYVYFQLRISTDITPSTLGTGRR